MKQAYLQSPVVIAKSAQQSQLTSPAQRREPTSIEAALMETYLVGVFLRYDEYVPEAPCDARARPHTVNDL